MKDKMRVSVQITVEKMDEDDMPTKSSSSYKDFYYSEGGDLERLLMAIIYAIPQQEFEKFDVIEIFQGGKVIAHGES